MSPDTRPQVSPNGETPKAERGCIFCKIVRGEAPSHKVYEDDRTLAFMDIMPAGEGHTLVIPKPHSENVFEARCEDLEAVMAASHRIAPAIRDALQPAGLRVIQLNGKAAGQTVFHYHMHLIPCDSSGALHLHGRRAADPEQLAALAERIAAKLRPGGGGGSHG